MLHLMVRRAACLALAGSFFTGCLLLSDLPRLIYADTANETNVNVLVKDAETNQPINQAHITLQFRFPGKVRSKMISYSAKTNAQGHYKFTNIPKGTVRLLVTAERHQSYGKEIDIEKDNQLIEITLRKPQPLL